MPEVITTSPPNIYKWHYHWNEDSMMYCVSLILKACGLSHTFHYSLYWWELCGCSEWQHWCCGGRSGGPGSNGGDCSDCSDGDVPSAPVQERRENVSWFKVVCVVCVISLSSTLFEQCKQASYGLNKLKAFIVILLSNIICSLHTQDCSSRYLLYWPGLKCSRYLRDSPCHLWGDPRLQRGQRWLQLHTEQCLLDCEWAWGSCCWRNIQ